MRVAIRFKTWEARVHGSYLLADQPGGVDCLVGGIYITDKRHLRVLKDKNGKVKYPYEIVDGSEVQRAIEEFLAHRSLSSKKVQSRRQRKAKADRT